MCGFGVLPGSGFGFREAASLVRSGWSTRLDDLLRPAGVTALQFTALRHAQTRRPDGGRAGAHPGIRGVGQAAGWSWSECGSDDVELPGSLPCRGPLGQPASINGARTSGICNAQAALTGVRAAHVQEGLRPRGRRLFANWGARISRTPHWWGGGAGGNRTRVLERRSRSSPGAVSVVAFLGPGARTDTSPTGPARMKSRSLLLAGSDQQVL